MAHINGNIPVERHRLPEDPEGAVDATVARMVEIAFGQYGSRSPRVRALAHEIVRKAGVREKDYYGEVVAIHNWIKKNIRYFRDPINQETLSHPEELLFNSKGGDCDDMVITEMALLGALGIRSFPVVIGQRPGTYSHVYLKAVIPPGKHRKAGRIIPLDPIMKNWAAGREAPSSRIGSKKEYRQTEAHMLNGDQDLGDVYSGIDDGRSLGAYASGPSYLDDENANVESLLVADKSPRTHMTHDLALSNQGEAKSVQNTPHVEQSMEGIDGMFGLGYIEDDERSVVQTQPADLGLRSRKPLTSEGAKRSHSLLPRGHKRKVYKGVREVMDCRVASGRRPVNTVSPNRKQVSVATNASAKAARNAAKAPLTPRERMAELDGLADYLQRAGRGAVLAGGLGADPAEVQLTAQDIATAGWWAKFKARLAAAREAYLGAKARHLEAEKDYCASKAMRDAQKAAKAEKDAAMQVAKQAKAVEKEASKNPQAARAMAETRADLDRAEAENGDTAAIDGLGWLGEDGGEPMPKSGQERAAQIARGRCERVEKKIQALQERIKGARKARAKARAEMRKRPIETPLDIRSVESQGQRTRPTPQQARDRVKDRDWTARPGQPAAPANEAAPREGIVLPQQWEAAGNTARRAMRVAYQRPAQALRGLGDLPTLPMPFLPSDSNIREVAESPAVQYTAAAVFGYLLLKRKR